MGDNQKPVENAHQNNKHGRQLFIFAMVFVMLFFAYVTFLHPHSSPDHVKEIREKIIEETQMPPAQAALKQEAAPAAAKVEATAAAAVANEAWISTPEKIARGAEEFKKTCALCHGEKGLGDGPAGMALKPAPRNFAEGKWKNGNSTIAIFNTITKGSPGTSMAAYETVYPEDMRWALAAYVKSIGKNIVDPTPAEIKSYKEKKK